MDVMSDFDGARFRQYESYTSDFYWCDKVLSGTRTSIQGLTTTSVKTTPWAGMDGSSCSSSDISNPKGLSAAGVEFPYFFNLDNRTTYNISGRTYQSMAEFLGSLIGESLNAGVTGIISTDASGLVTPEPGIPSQAFQLSKFMWANDIEAFTNNLADVLTINMLTPKGDNMNVTTVTGYMIFDDTYIQIEWPWLILPLFETMFTCVLLAVTVVLTRNQPLLKNSSIALLVHGLAGWTPEELKILQPETAESLEMLAGDMTARLTKDERGVLKFSREDKGD